MALAKVNKIMLRNTAASHGSFMFVDARSFAPFSLNTYSYGEQSIDFYTCPYSGDVPDKLYSFFIRAARGNSSTDSPMLYSCPNLDIYFFTSEPWVTYRGKVTSENICRYDDGSTSSIHCEFCLYHDKNPATPPRINTESVSGSNVHIVPGIERIIFNDPATIVFWTDGTKTVVKAHEDEFSEEHGLAMAIARKFLECHGCEFPRAGFKRLVREATR